MDFGLTDEQREIQRTARELLSARATPERIREHGELGRADDELWRELCELGWAGIAVTEEDGGQGLGHVELSILCEELGRAVAPVAFLPTVLATTFIAHAGNEEQRAQWLPGLCSGELRGAAGAPGVVPGADGADVVVLVAEGGGRIVTEPGRPVGSIDPARPAAWVGEGTELDGETLSGEDFAGALDRALVAVAAELVGICDRALTLTVSYVGERRQFGVPVGAFQAVSHRCAEMLLATEKARSTVAFASWAADADPERLPEAAAMAKAAAADAGREVTASAIQAHGGIGFTWEAEVHWLYKRAQVDALLLGGASEHRRRLTGMLAVRSPGRQAPAEQVSAASASV